jgi:hypothetical protein
MLKIYGFVRELIKRLRSLISVIERKDRDLGRQLRRCTASVLPPGSRGQWVRWGDWGLWGEGEGGENSFCSAFPS